jgi:TetR/AcrR family transcriptional repressor of lmrAB and yxaGH operons
MSENRGVRARVLNTALRLFYTQGIQNTGINQLIDESRVAKASFYRYFPSKRDLIRVCILEYDKYIKGKLASLVLDSNSFNEFIKKWIVMMKEDFRLVYRGCPMSEAVFQLDKEDPELTELVKSIVIGWEGLVTQFFDRMIHNKKLPSNIDVQKVSKRVLHLYEGAATMWRITGDDSYIDDLEFLMEKLLQE